MDEVDQNCDDELIIVNRRCEYCVSKKFICSVVPYFKKLFSSDKLTSKENKVTLDFDERSFDALLNWVHTDVFIIRMDYVISFYEAADYLKIDDCLREPFIDYFNDNFTMELLPVVLRQVTQKSPLINSGAVNSFICRHFLKIANTDTFLDYPVETLEHILQLDLMIHSEYQVFESIMKWVNNNGDSRKELLPQLLRCVRWSTIDPFGLSKVKENEFIKTLQNFDSIISSKSDCGFNRSKQNYFVSLHRLGNSKLRINIFDKKLFSLPIGDFTKDDTMSTQFVHENISDILFDSGRKGIRVDWNKKTFAWLDIDDYDGIYYKEMYKLIVNFQNDRSEYSCYLDAKATALPETTPRNSYLLLEHEDSFVCIGETHDDNKYFGIFPVTDSSWFNFYMNGCGYEFHATILDNVVYVLTEEFNFFQFNMETRSYNKNKLFKGAKDLHPAELILTSLHTEDDKIILIDGSTGKFYVYCIKQKKWFKKYEIFNVNPNSKDSHEDIHELMAFTSTFLPMKNIKPMFRRDLL
ncbi:kelch-like protein 8 [Tetranychus urticae]|uniref:kelch-like protein 8 n=1 Tax=Tetranychus urticae TaxID=32264 RepID=UPI00077BDE30|nr:kelch-like protein 8 [Tetranychus urticae]